MITNKIIITSNLNKNFNVISHCKQIKTHKFNNINNK